MAIDTKNIEVVRSWPVPSTMKELQGFLGLAGYYRKFVQHFDLISRPLTDMLKKHVVFLWIADMEAAFQTLKQELVTTPVLVLSYFKKIFEVETDASDKGIGAVLMQDGHPLAYLSKSLSPRTQGLSTYEKESLAIILAIDHWRSYLQHATFVIRTDQQSLVYLERPTLDYTLATEGNDQIIWFTIPPGL